MMPISFNLEADKQPNTIVRVLERIVAKSSSEQDDTGQSPGAEHLSYSAGLDLRPQNHTTQLECHNFCVPSI